MADAGTAPNSTPVSSSRLSAPAVNPKRLPSSTVSDGSTQTENKGRPSPQLVSPQGSGQDAVVPHQVTGTTQTDPPAVIEEEIGEAVVPTVHVCLIRTVRIPPRQSTFVQITAETELLDTPVLFEPSAGAEQGSGVYMEDCLLEPRDDGITRVSITNPTATTQIIQAGKELGQVSPVSIVQVEGTETLVGRVLSARGDPQQAASQEKSRKAKLIHAVGELDLPEKEREAFQAFLMSHHHAFSLEDGERGETDLIQMEIDTGDAHPRKQRARRLPLALRQVVAQQLKEM